MKAYKCDICKKYCDTVLTIHGISQPITHKFIFGLFGQSADCCENCYDNIMEYIVSMMPKEGIK